MNVLSLTCWLVLCSLSLPLMRAGVTVIIIVIPPSRHPHATYPRIICTPVQRILRIYGIPIVPLGKYWIPSPRHACIHMYTCMYGMLLLHMVWSTNRTYIILLEVSSIIATNIHTPDRKNCHSTILAFSLTVWVFLYL